MKRQSQPGLHGFEVLSNEQIAQDIWRMRIEVGELAADIVPGQFVNIRVPGDASEILRLPLSFARATQSELELVYAVVGRGTKRLRAMRPSECSDLVGPCGNGWSLPQEQGRVLLVAGGVGLAPILAAADLLTGASIGFDVVVGASSASKLWEEGVERLRTAALRRSCDCARRVYVTTDDGSCGITGLVTEASGPLLQECEYAELWACGSAPMLRAVAEQALQAQTECKLSLERMMGCGFGVCAGCNVALRDGSYALCCTDGPVFDARELAW